MSTERLEQIQARADEADAAPWRTEQHDLSLWVHSADEGLEANLGYVGNRPENNAEFIANAREDVPYLLALVREQAAKIGRVEALRNEWFRELENPDHLIYFESALDSITAALSGEGQE